MSAALQTGADARAMRTTKYPPEFSKRVDMTKVHLPVIKKWVADEIARILNSDDDVVTEMINGILEGSKNPNIKQLQNDVSGFLDKDAAPFCLELWKLCLSAQANPNGIPKELLEAKKNELAQDKIAEERAREEAMRRQEEDRQRDRDMARIRDRERGQRRGGRGGWRGRERSYDRRPPSRDYSRSRSPPPRRRDAPRVTDSYVPGRGRRDDYAPRRRRSPSYDRSRSPTRSRTPPRRRRRNTSSEVSSSPPRRRSSPENGDLMSRADRGKDNPRLSREASSQSEEPPKANWSLKISKQELNRRLQEAKMTHRVNMLLSVPSDVTTYQWAFESPATSPVVYSNNVGHYENASTNERLSFSRVKDHATYLSTALIQEYGFQPGDTASIFAGNSVWYPVALWATVRGGGKINGASPDYGVDEMVHALKTAGTRYLFTTKGSLDRAMEAVRKVGLDSKRVFLLEGKVDGVMNVKQLVERGKKYTPQKSWSIPAGKKNWEVCGYLNFSSGTTGLPKAVELSHHNLIAQCHQLREYQVFDPGEGYRSLAITPVYHISGLVRYIHYPLLLNGECYMMPSFNMEAFLSSIITYRIPELILVPPIVIRLVRDAIVDKYLADLRRTVKRWSSGSAPASPEVIQMLHAKFPDTGFRQGYGATESTGCITCHPPTHYDYKYSTTGGKLVPNTIAKVLSLDNTSLELGPNETGEICAKGPQIAMGYHQNPTATAETFDTDGYFHTGDIGYFTPDGLIHIVDRIKEMIKVRGQQVAPAELEDVIHSHPLVADCAVLGIADDYSGEKPKAYVVLKEGVKGDVEMGREILKFVRERKVGYKRLKEVEFTGAVPRSPTGKVLRRVLKAEERRDGRSRGVVVREEERRAKL